MQVKVIIFGQLADITGAGELTVDNVSDTQALAAFLSAHFPAFASARYAIAVDKKIVSANTPLDERSTVALLPPFSGG